MIYYKYREKLIKMRKSMRTILLLVVFCFSTSLSATVIIWNTGFETRTPGGDSGEYWWNGGGVDDARYFVQESSADRDNTKAHTGTQSMRIMASNGGGNYSIARYGADAAAGGNVKLGDMFDFSSWIYTDKDSLVNTKILLKFEWYSGGWDFGDNLVSATEYDVTAEVGDDSWTYIMKTDTAPATADRVKFITLAWDNGGGSPSGFVYFDDLNGVYKPEPPGFLLVLIPMAIFLAVSKFRNKPS